MGSGKSSCATNFDYSFMVLLIGDSGVGKSSLLLSFISNCQEFPRDLSPTIELLIPMAAIDYTVCLHSEVFITTQGGNFPQFLLGHRRYLYGGHSRTIRPDKQKLALLFDNTNNGLEAYVRRLRRYSCRKAMSRSYITGPKLRKWNGAPNLLEKDENELDEDESPGVTL